MRSAFLLPLLPLLAGPALAQAPPSAGLWRVAAASLIVPAALSDGPAGAAWNPAHVAIGSRLEGGIQVVHTSDELGISGIEGGVSTTIAGWAAVGAVVGRIDVRDLVRTTTTPGAVGGSIPVYTQYAGVVGAVRRGSVQLATLLRLHDERFDYLGETGLTLDVGMTVEPSAGLVVAAATHFFPVDFSRQNTTDYYFGLEYEMMPRVNVGGVSAAFVGRYGANLRSGESLEHSVGAGLVLGSALRLDAALTRETGYEGNALRPGLGISLSLGRYLIGLTRSSGINGLGATYRAGLSASVLE